MVYWGDIIFTFCRSSRTVLAYEPSGESCLCDLMNQEFVERLPWRIAALAGLVVGAVSLWAGIDLWVSLLRVGVAFAVFGLTGLGLRALLRSGPVKAVRGGHVDQVTPPMSVGDVTEAAEDASRGGDENRT